MAKQGRDYGIEGESWQSRKMSTNALRKATIADFNKMIRAEAADDDGFCHCCTCDKVFRWDGGIKEAHSGHFVAGSTSGVVFDERNCHPQCPRCNYYMDGNQEVYSTFMLERYGPLVIAELQALRRVARKYYRSDYLEMRAGFRARIKVQKQRLGH